MVLQRGSGHPAQHAWGRSVTDAHGYPRPQLQRAEWTSLNGAWDFAFDPEARWSVPAQVSWDRTIIVPFAPESPASGVGDTGLCRAFWYRRSFEAPQRQPGERLLLHFGAVDYAATVWLNGQLAGGHEGGYTPFTLDVTGLLLDGRQQELVVRAEDDPTDLAKPRGKQDWLPEPHLIWYPRTSGIWQTVWLERVPARFIGSLRWTPNLERWEIMVEVRVDGAPRDDLSLRIVLKLGDWLLADDTCAVIGGEVARRIVLSDPGIDDGRNELAWSPASPTLIPATLELRDGRGEVIDVVRSYTALRSIQLQEGRFLLNGRPLYLRLALDQGYWPESGLTAPDDAALRRDVELARAMGFNGVRKHQKIEAPRFLYWADRLGLLVWEEMPSAYRFTDTAVRRLTHEWIEVLRRDSSHPCIVAWVPFNESWGVPNLPTVAEQRHYVQALYHLTRALDPTRPVIGNDGWEHVAGDIVTLHDYDDDPQRLARRFQLDPGEPAALARVRPEGRLSTCGEFALDGKPVMLTEFGGIGFSRTPDGTWGYVRLDRAEALAERYADLLETVRSIELLAGFCYTQFADTYQEVNGLLYADRTPKFPLEEIERATRGSRTARDLRVEWQQRERRERVARRWNIPTE